MSFSSDVPLQANQLPISIDWPKDQNQFLNELDNTYKHIANVVNTKSGGYFLLQEQAAFNRYYKLSDPFGFRSVYRYVYDMIDLNGGNIAAGATVNFPTNITGLTALTLAYATARTTTGKMFCLTYPYVYVQGANVYLNNPEANQMSKATVVLEYVKE